MAYQTIGDYGVNGSADIILYTAQVSPSFIPWTLFSLFLIAIFGTYNGTKRLFGRANFAASFAVAGFVTVTIALMMTLIPGLIDNITLGVTVVVAIVGVIFLMTIRD